MKTQCQKTQNDVQNGTVPSVLGSLFQSPGSDWWRHAVLRVVEVVVGVAVVIVGVRTLARGSETVNVVASGVRKVGKKL